jgi:hypothetical protein
MEINDYSKIQGAVTMEAITEGRMVVLDKHSMDHNFGSRKDLPGVRIPANATEAARARFCLTFAVDNAEPPLFEPYPAMDFALRGGFDQAANVPFTAKVHLTQPSMKEGQVVPSGALALAFGEGTYTVPSGAFVASADLEPGAYLAVSNKTDHNDDAGKLRYSADATFAEVLEYDTVKQTLTFRILY